jgi:hypothetical protein
MRVKAIIHFMGSKFGREEKSKVLAIKIAQRDSTGVIRKHMCSVKIFSHMIRE